MDSSRININFITPFIEGTIETIHGQCALGVTSNPPFFKGHGPSIQADIVATIRLVSPKINGSVQIYFPKALFLVLMQGMLEEKYSSITSEIEDGACELLGILFGKARRTLNQHNFFIKSAIPALGHSLLVNQNPISKSSVILPFKCESNDGVFYLEITTDPLEG